MQQKTIAVDVPLYGLEALHKACYAFLERVYMRLEGDPAGTVRVHLRQKADGPQSLDALSGEFENELIHQALRVRMTAANQKIREYIVTRALASAEGVAPGRPPADGPKPQQALDEDLEKEIEKLLAEVEKEGGDDPLKITVPWEDKQGAADAGNGPGAKGKT